MNLLLLFAAALVQEPAPVAVFPYAVDGAIMEADAADPDTGHPSDTYRLLLSAGTRYRFAATGSGDTRLLTLELRAIGADHYVANDYAHAPPLAAQLIFGPPATGIYVVRISSTLPGNSSLETAPYRLTVTPLAADALPLAPTPATTRPAAWRVWEGSLTSADPDDVAGLHFHEYRLRLEAGRDTIIMAERVSPGVPGAADEGHLNMSLSVRAVTTDPDDMFDYLGGGGGSPTGPAVTTVRPRQAGDYIVRVMAAVSDAPIAYRLSVAP